MLNINLKSYPYRGQQVMVVLDNNSYQATIIDFNDRGNALLSIDLGDITDTFKAVYTVQREGLKLLRGLRYTATVLALVESVIGTHKPENVSIKNFVTDCLNSLSTAQQKELLTKNIRYNGTTTKAFEI